MSKRQSIFIFFLWLSVSLTAGIHTYHDHSVLSSGKWVKIAVTDNGVYRLTFDQIRSAGLDPNNLRIYGYGGAMLLQNFRQPKIDDLPVVPYYKGSNYVLFYGQGPVSWSYNGSLFTHTINPYATQGYYFLTDNSGDPAILTDGEALDATGATDIYTYSEYVVHEIEKVNLMDYDNGREGGGRVFYGEKLTPSQPKLTIDMPFLHTPVADIPMSAHAEVAARSGLLSNFQLTINEQSSACFTAAIALTSDFYTRATTGMIYAEYLPSPSSTQRATLTFSNTEGTSFGYLDFIELTATVPLQMVGDYMPFRSTEGTGSVFGESTNLLYHLSGVREQMLIWDITNRDSIYQVPTTMKGDTLLFVGSNTNGVREYIAVNPAGTQWLTPTIVGSVATQDLHALKDIDLVIITPSEFMDASLALAAAHERHDGITTAVVTDQQVYNEFSSGTPDATAYRWLMKMLYDRSSEGEGQAPKSLLLMGTGSFDNRKLLTTSGNNILLTYQAKNSTVETSAYVTDDYFGFLDDNEGDSDISGRMDIGVGRLPALTNEEAWNMVNKIIRYMENTSYGKWKNRLLFLADDGDHGLHTRVAEAGAELVRVNNQDFVVNKIYTDSYQQETTASGDRYPLARTRLHNLINSGVLFFDYSGHAGANEITNEKILDSDDIRALTNENLAFWMFVTCSFSHFDRGANTRSAGEYAVLNPNGGAIGVLSATRTVYASQNEVINRYFCDTLFSHTSVYDYPMTIGEATRLAKNKTGNDPNKLPYVLLADPALRLNYPTQVHVQTEAVADTVRALDIDTIRGYISSTEEDTATWFNGKVQITFYDKMQQLRTRDNDERTESKKKIEVFNDYPNIIFNGEAEVVDGHFTLPYRLPRDIHYNYGTGRIVYYAYSPEEGAEGIGHYNDVVIGGSSSQWLTDTVGPDIQLWLNTPAFTNGGTTHENPHFYASVEDESGINIAGTGIGHDLMLIMDNDIQNTYIMNDYFTTESGSYTKGIVSFTFDNIPEGKHSLFFRAWDLNNNSSNATLDFTVVKNLAPTLYEMGMYPNPVPSSGVLHTHIEYDRSESICEATLRIYDPAGRPVYEKTQTGGATMEWNMSESAISGGIYIYQFEIKTTTSGSTIRKGKLFVLN